MRDSSEINRTLGDSIISIRKKNNLTQDEFAEKLGVTRQAVSRWEMGLSAPNIYTLTTISELFDVPVSEILKENPNSKKGPYDKENVQETVEYEITAKKHFSPYALFPVLCLIAGIVVFVCIPIMILHIQNIERDIHDGFYSSASIHLTQYPCSLMLAVAIILIFVSIVLFCIKYRRNKNQ